MRRFGIVVAGHGALADGLVTAAGLITGSTEDVRAAGLAPDDSPESFAERLSAAIAIGQPTLVLTDLWGGTPHNVTIGLRRPGVWSIAGVNLGLLVEAMTTSEPLTDALVARFVATAREGIAAADVGAGRAATPPTVE